MMHSTNGYISTRNVGLTVAGVVVLAGLAYAVYKGLNVKSRKRR